MRHADEKEIQSDKERQNMKEDKKSLIAEGLSQDSQL